MNSDPSKANSATNGDLMRRLDDLEVKVDQICDKLNQATGAWFFVKILSSITLGFAILWNAFHGLFNK